MAYTTINKSTDYFNTKLWSGNGSSQALTGVGHQTDMVWIKSRTDTRKHNMYDVVRGVQKRIVPNDTPAEDTVPGVTAFGTDGFTVGSETDTNGGSRNFVGWSWKAGGGQGSSNTDGSINTTYTSVNTTAGFSISKYTGNATSGATIGHGLGVTPKMIIIKGLGTTYNWIVGHNSLSTNWSKYLTLSTGDTAQTATNIFNDTAPTSSVFSIGNALGVNTNNSDYIAYCFAEKQGYSKFGSYAGNQNNDGTFVYTGFKPSFIIIKRYSSGNPTSTNWQMFDNKRIGYNPSNYFLFPSLVNAEDTSNPQWLDIHSNGFKIRNTGADLNNSGHDYIYMAFGQSIVGSNNIPCNAR